MSENLYNFLGKFYGYCQQWSQRNEETQRNDYIGKKKWPKRIYTRACNSYVASRPTPFYACE